MKKFLNKKTASFAIIILTILPVFLFSLSVSAQEIDPGIDVIKDEINMSDKDPRVIAAGVINTLMGFLGIVAVIIILLGGFKWMTAGGSEEKIGEAKKLLIAGVIGLIIIISAFGVATFVINNLLDITSN